MSNVPVAVPSSDPTSEIVFDSIEDALVEVRAGRPLVVVDSADRENEGDVLLAAEKATPEAVNFMVRECRGLICAPLSGARLHALGLEQMVASNTDLHQTRFTVSVDCVSTTTGISAFDRSATLLELADDAAGPERFRRPGHVFPLRAEEGGVLRRAGHTEAAVDLARMAGLKPAGVICEILREDGRMARLPDLVPFAKRHGLKLIRIEDLIRHRIATEKLVERLSSSKLPTEHGLFTIHAYRSRHENLTHLALVMGDVSVGDPVLVRVHSECFTGDVLGSTRCDCGPQLQAALAAIAKEGRGVVLYLKQEGRGIGIVEKLKAYALQDEGLDTVEANLRLGHAADLRDYGVGAGILRDLGLKKLRLLTNNPRKIVGLAGYGLEVTERTPLVIPAGPHNEKYLAAKRSKLGHLF